MWLFECAHNNYIIIRYNNLLIYIYNNYKYMLFINYIYDYELMLIQ